MNLFSRRTWQGHSTLPTRARPGQRDRDPLAKSLFERLRAFRLTFIDRIERGRQFRILLNLFKHRLAAHLALSAAGRFANGRGPSVHNLLHTRLLKE
jgi:hypothetical protein